MTSNREIIERVVMKIPKNVADYFRASFPHGSRSEFITRCILDFKKKKEVEKMEEQLKAVRKKRQ